MLKGNAEIKYSFCIIIDADKITEKRDILRIKIIFVIKFCGKSLFLHIISIMYVSPGGIEPPFQV